MKKLSLILLAIFLASAGSTSVNAKGNSADLFVVSLNAPDTVEKPNSSYEEDEEEEKYSVGARSHNWYGERYTVYLHVEDPDHEATSVEITGPGITGSLSLDYDNNGREWNSLAKEDKLLYFGISPPTPPLTYTFTIVDPSETIVRTDTVESFVSVYATNLSPSGGETITGPPVFSWTGVGSGYYYEVIIFDQEFLPGGSMNYVWDSDDVGEETSVRYDGPALISGAKYYYLVVAGNEYEDSSIARESFVYQPGPDSISGTVSYTGATTGPIYVAAFTDPTFSGEPTYYVELSSLGSYTLPGLSDGTYYVVSTMATGDDGEIMITDPWDVYGSIENPTPVTITGGIGESGIDITLVDGTEENPNPFGEEPYSVSVQSRNSSDGERYGVGFLVKDPDHEATSVEITGPGITGSLSLDYSNNGREWNSWHSGKDVDFGSSPPTPPLTYTFTIVVSSTTIVRTDTVESFVSVYATNLSPSGGETITGPLVFSWTGVGPGYIYMVDLFTEGNWVWWSDDLTVTSVSYDGPALTPGAEYLFVVRVNDEDWNSSSIRESFVYQDKTGVEEDMNTERPSVIYLSQNYPNPFNPTTTISYSIPQRDFVQLKVYNVVGELVRTLVREEKSHGRYTAIWDGRNYKGRLVSSGVYFYTLNTSGNNVISKRMLLHK